MARSIRSFHLFNENLTYCYSAKNLVLKEGLDKPSTWRTCPEDRKLREFPWKICLLKFNQKTLFFPAYFNMFKLSIRNLDESDSTFIFSINALKKES